jgi:hypothetical protein
MPPPTRNVEAVMNEASSPPSRATLAHVARILGTYGIDMEVVGIRAA